MNFIYNVYSDYNIFTKINKDKICDVTVSPNLENFVQKFSEWDCWFKVMNTWVSRGAKVVVYLVVLKKY